MKEQLQRIRDRYGTLRLLRLVLFPLSQLLVNPVRLIQTLWNSRVLLDGRIGGYSHFTARDGLLSLFYWTGFENLVRHGRTGVSPTLGLGRYRLSQWFMWPFLGLGAYVRLAPLIPPCCMAWWLTSHLMWMNQTPWYYLFVVLALCSISSSFSMHALASQNYNLTGWAFLPLTLYALLHGDWGLASVMWLGASTGGVTAIAIGVPIFVAVAAVDASSAPLIAMLPAVFRCCCRAVPSLVGGQLREESRNILKAIGVSHRNVRYRLHIRTAFWSLDTLLRLALYLQFGVVLLFMCKNPSSILYFVCLLLFFFNYLVARLFDSQSLDIALMSCATACVLSQPSIPLIVSFWLAISPPPVALGIAGRDPDVLPALKPFPVGVLIQAVGQLLRPVGPGQRVLMAFDDPRGDYRQLFDGYRYLMEVPHYVATMNRFHCLPDWWAVFETNYEGAPEFWGRSPDCVLKNAHNWGADYALVYLPAGTPLDPTWERLGFRMCSFMSWTHFEPMMLPARPYPGPAPDWWLLAVPGR
ncbi:MAG: hypothetical protein AB1758_08305 [Candidatus Eremiobacterota bacterium]